MKGYAAYREGNAIYLTKDEQMDEMLEIGCDIVRIEDDETITVIATPEDGFIEERPTLKAKTETTSNPYAKEMKLLLEKM